MRQLAKIATSPVTLSTMDMAKGSETLAMVKK